MSSSTVRSRAVRVRRKDRVFCILGNHCVECGSTEDLTVDHIGGKRWIPENVHSTKRWRIYLEEAEKGLLRCLCRRCNSKLRWAGTEAEGFF